MLIPNEPFEELPIELYDELDDPELDPDELYIPDDPYSAYDYDYYDEDYDDFESFESNWS